MEFMLDKRGHVVREGKQEQDHDEDEDEEIVNKDMGNFQFSSFPYDHNNQTFSLGKSTFDESEQDPSRSHHHHPPASTIASNFNNMEVVGLAPPRRSHEFGGSRSSSGYGVWYAERVHMFDKVVTPSDVGKLNRLVIPKQHAERFFPLDASTNEKDLLLNFEDRNGKPWRFRYSYWTSSQSYVITKGWSRFVKEKRLDAGDVVSFHRGLGESGKDRFYIDWRNRPASPNFAALQPSDFARLSRFYSSFPPPSGPVLLYTPPQDHLLFGGLSLRQQQVQDHHQFQQLQQHGSMLLHSRTRHHHHDHHQHERVGHGHDHDSSAYDQHRVLNSGPSSIGGAVSHSLSHHDQVEGIHMAIESSSSMPVVHRNGTAAAPKRLRLFGVNMECSNSSPDDEFNSQ